MLTAICGMTGTCHHTQIFSVEMRFHELYFCAGWSGTMILLISASYVAKIQA
jgi:hypothetical protein